MGTIINPHEATIPPEEIRLRKIEKVVLFLFKEYQLMSADAVRTHAPVIPATTANGTDNDDTDPRIWTFNKPSRPVVVVNRTGYTIWVKTNETDAFDGNGTSRGHHVLADNEVKDISFGGRVSVTTASAITTNASGDLDNIEILGWEA